MNDISLTNIESTKNIYPVLTRLNLFNEIERAWKLRWQDIVSQNASLSGTTTNSLHGVAMKFDAHIPTSEGTSQFLTPLIETFSNQYKLKYEEL